MVLLEAGMMQPFCCGDYMVKAQVLLRRIVLILTTPMRIKLLIAIREGNIDITNVVERWLSAYHAFCRCLKSLFLEEVCDEEGMFNYVFVFLYGSNCPGRESRSPVEFRE